MPSSPGTVSKILWHFTGGPRWNNALQRQELEPKPSVEAYNALVSILHSKELRLGKYKEIVRAIVRRENGHKSDYLPGLEDLGVFEWSLDSSPVCCLADIPIAHLGYHADRYGKLAIGFHRTAAMRHGFSPVLYLLQESEIIRDFVAAYAGLEEMNWLVPNYDFSKLASGKSMLGNTKSLINETYDKYHFPDLLEEAEGTIEDFARLSSSIQEKLKPILALVKTFEENELNSIYCEREWRSTKGFSFEYDDIAMVAVPREQTDYFHQLIEHAQNNGLPPTVPIVAWEDLVEH